uniref:CCHC-type domain-containing protein n=1 Tax=Cajanus cajan TaxID=3821 RepID=A0A151RBM1_CAJCA|nr:hypothetical protein KK1_038797 [Cajanus cajan]
MKVEQIFTCHQVSEERKVSLATLSFQGHAMYWWTSLVRDRRLHNDPPIQYWNELRSTLRRRHIPSYYTRVLINKLQRLHQRNLIVEEYRQTMELYLMRAGIREQEDITIARFLSDKGKAKEEKEKKNTSHTSTKSSDINCFKCLRRGHIASQCPNKKVMILRGQDIYSSQDEATTSPSSSEDEEEASEGESCEVTYPYNGELLMMRRVLNNQPSDTQSQRENIFHTRCNISNKACSLIVDSGSWCNCLEFSIGNYQDKVKCDVVPMEACHILLGRPWQFDKQTHHDGLTNKITFTHKEIVQREKFETKTLQKTSLLLEPSSHILMCRGTLTCTATSSLETSLPFEVKNLLKEFDDVFPSEGPVGLPPFKGIEHQIDLVPRASLPNKPAYRTNLQETKEIEKQVQELLDKGWIQKSLSPCVVLVILVPKKIENRGCVVTVEPSTTSQ